MRALLRCSRLVTKAKVLTLVGSSVAPVSGSSSERVSVGAEGGGRGVYLPRISSSISAE